MWSSWYPFDELWALTQLAHDRREPTRVAGVDVTYSGDRYVAALVVFDGPGVADIRINTGESREAYKPTVFFLKEGPIISALLDKASIDLLFVNGHGICHPYSYGLATVVGMTHGIPTIGFARHLIRGQYQETPSDDPMVAYIVQEGIIKALAIRAPKSRRPLYVSQGFGISLKKTLHVYRRWAIRGRVPEPLRLAHIHAREHMKEKDRSPVGPQAT